MKWNRNEIDRLSPILEQISIDLAPVDGKRILVLCSAAGEVAFRLAEMMEMGKVTGLEMDVEALELARRTAHEMGLEGMVEFLPADKDHIRLEAASFNAVVSEFIVYPSSTPTDIGLQEMARMLAPGGKMILTDVIVTLPLNEAARKELETIGLDYLCEATKAEFRAWAAEAGLINITVQDLTSILRQVWEARRDADLVATHQKGYEYLLYDPRTSLGRAIHYIYVSGEKPKPQL